MAKDKLEPKVKIKIKVEKYDGDPPKKGENKKPVEVIEIEREVPASLFPEGKF